MTFIIGTPYTSGSGYYMNDDTPSGGVRSEADVRTCPHCQAVILMQQWRRMEGGTLNGGFCMRCFAPVCNHCNKKMQTEGCIPFVAKVEQMLGEAERLRLFRKLAGLDTPAAQHVPLYTGT